MADNVEPVIVSDAVELLERLDARVTMEMSGMVESTDKYSRFGALGLDGHVFRTFVRDGYTRCIRSAREGWNLPGIPPLVHRLWLTSLNAPHMPPPSSAPGPTRSCCTCMPPSPSASGPSS